MSLLKILTGGKAEEADKALGEALKAIQSVNVPTKAELTLPELQQYVNAGILTPAQAQAVLQQQNAYDSIKTDPSAREAEMTALNRLQDVASAGGMTDTMKAQLTEALDRANTNTQGVRGSILDNFAKRGVPTSLMAGAMEQAAAAQDARAANLSATQAAGQAEQNALNAMTQSANVAGNIRSQDYSEADRKAAAANAISQWNAENQTTVNRENANRAQDANVFNTQTDQAVSNANTQNANARTGYNTQVPQTVYQDQLQKAQAEADIRKSQAIQATGQGEQNAAEMAALTGASFSFFGAGPGGKQPSGTGNQASSSNSSGSGGGGGSGGSGGSGGFPQGQFDANSNIYGAGSGGNVPGRPSVPGDSSKNDNVHAMLSPGEVVIPRSIAGDPERVKQFVTHLIKQPKPIRPMHPEDLHGMMDALARRREGVA